MRFHCYEQGQWFGYDGKLFLDTLANTKLNYLDLLIRESIQNSFDARKPDSIPEYTIHGRTLTDESVLFLRQMLSDDQYPSVLKSKIKNQMFCLEVRDSETTGLMGSFQQYDAYGNEIQSEFTNYKSFIWSLGGSKSENNGGSHGVGKTSFFIVSQLRTVCVYTRTKYQGALQSRFIIKSFYPYDGKDIKQYWLGDDPEKRQSPKEQIPLPFLDEEADFIASKLGIEPYVSSETGTTVLLLDADFNIDEEEQKRILTANEYYQNNAVPMVMKWFWPKLLDLSPVNQKISIHVRYEGSEIPFPVLNDSEYDFFTACFRRWHKKYLQIRNMSNEEKCKLPKDKGFISICGVRPKLFTGGIAYGKTSLITPKQKEMFFSGNNNVCLIFMRGIEFCVKYKGYLAQNLAPGEFVFAIFHTDPENHLPNDKTIGSVDNAFRLAEDNSHEEWTPNLIQNNSVARSCVRVSLQKIDEAIENEFSFHGQSSRANDTSGALALKLGRFLPWNNGIGASMRRDTDNPSAPPRKKVTKERLPNKFEMVSAPDYLDHGVRILKFSLEVKKGISYPVLAKLSVKTTEGLIDADDLVVLQKVSYKMTGTNIGMIAYDQKTGFISLKCEGKYIFTFLAKGDIEFSCDLKKVEV